MAVFGLGMSENIEMTEEVIEESNEADAAEISDDPIVVLQVLQVKEREYSQVLRRLVEERELVRDVVNHTVETVINKTSGFLGIIIVAFKGRKVSKEIGAKLDRLIEYEVALDERISQMSEVLETIDELKRKSEINADDKNTLVLRQRCIMYLDREFDDAPLIAAAKSARGELEEYKAMLSAAEEVEAQKKEELKAKKRERKPKSKINLEEKILANS
jgi:hypothetical protein